MSTTRFLTGITTTGTPHLGNFVGSIRPSVAASLRPGVQSFYFLADYHALIKCEDPARIQRSTLEIAASWLAAGLDPEKVTFYRQSDIPEIPELTWLLTCVTGKGLLNRAHAYKAAQDKNAAAGREPDDGVTAGLFMYPVLMGADILMFNAHKVPVGRDQIQHIEMARDMAASFNHLYGEHFTLPEAAIDEHVATLPGLDGRKMSKSYDNTIPLFSSREQLQKLIGGILTDSRAPGEPKEVEGSALFQIYQAFATPEETDACARPMPRALPGAMPSSAVRAHRPRRGAHARALYAVGLRNLRVSSVDAKAGKTGGAKTALPSFKQYRESDGRFHFKLVDAQGRLLLQSQGFASPKDAGAAIGRLQREGATAWQALGEQLGIAEGASENDVAAALQQLVEASSA
jgi:tryptophanyl-tRNA synthetase